MTDAREGSLMTTIPTSTFDAATLRRAYSGHDVEALLGLYAEDATVEIVDAQHAPSDPIRLNGRDAIRELHSDVLSRDMTHAVDIVAVSGDSAGYVLRCAY